MLLRTHTPKCIHYSGATAITLAAAVKLNITVEVTYIRTGYPKYYMFVYLSYVTYYKQFHVLSRQANGIRELN